MTWALTNSSDVNRIFWEWSPEEDNLLEFRIPLLSLQHASNQNLHEHLQLNLNLDLASSLCTRALGAPPECCLLPHFCTACLGVPGPALRKPLLSPVRPLVEDSDNELCVLQQERQDLVPAFT